LKSWWTAGHFIQEQFGVFEFESSPPDTFDVTPVDYMEGNTTLRGYLALPDTMWKRPLPAVVVLPDWSGVDDYEKERAQLLADKGYVAFAADIYGADLQVELDFPQRIELVTGFSMDIPKYVRRIQAAVDQVKANMEVDAGEIAIIGYCFGGSGVVLYTFNGTDDVKVAVGFHGSYTSLPPPSGTINPYLLM
jgi:dienelactone hydrolase